MSKLYQLKPGQEAFLVMDGDFAGRRYERVKIYHQDQIPPEHLGRFEALVITGRWGPDTPPAEENETEPAAVSEEGDE